VASALTLAMARPILRHPGEQTAGAEFAGRFRDPFVVMRQYDAGAVPPPFLQPATDLPGIFLARHIGGLAAYNLLDLVTFPLAALGAYVLTWALTRSLLASMAAGLIFAWSPFHVAQAAYHLHIAQVQWLPLVLLSAWCLVTRPSVRTAAALAASAAVLCAASFYLGFIGAVIAPAALVIASFVAPIDPSRSRSRTVAVTMIVAMAGAVAAAVALIVAPSWLSGEVSRYAFTARDQTLYAARWASYFVPPAGSVEQQIAPGWSVAALAVAGIWLAFDGEDARVRGPIIWLLAIGAIAAVCSTEPGARVLFALSPFFRAHARFAVVVTLAASVCAGIGADLLWRRPRLRWITVVLLGLVAVELRPAAARARDVLPSPAYRWVVTQPDWKVLDCTPPGREYGVSIAVLLGERAGFREGVFEDCADPEISVKLASLHYTHVIIRTGSGEGRWLAAGGRRPGLDAGVAFTDQRVFAVTAAPAAIYTSGIIGFHAREFDGVRTWRWMPREAEWLVTNASASPVAAVLDVRAAAFEGPRRLEIWPGAERAAFVAIAGDGWYHLGPVVLPPGESRIALRVPEGDAMARAVLGNGDDRRLAIRFDDWRWRPAAGVGR
jgi:hypothetical protein